MDRPALRDRGTLLVLLSAALGLLVLVQAYSAYRSSRETARALVQLQEHAGDRPRMEGLEQAVVALDANMNELKERLVHLEQRADAVDYSLRTVEPARTEMRGKQPPIRTKEVVSPDYHVDRIYKSMMGPMSSGHLSLAETEKPELIWVVGYTAEVIDTRTENAASQEYMCHANLSLGDVPSHRRTVPGPPRLEDRLFTLSQGLQVIHLPDGFGIPVASTEPFRLTTQVLNLNDSHADLHLKHRVRVQYVRDRDLAQPMKPLFQRAVQILKSLDHERVIGVAPADVDPAVHDGCDVGIPASDSQYVADDLQQGFTGHWIVAPGREVSRNNVTRWLALHRDTTVHYIAVHLHPFAESLELVDRTEGRTVFKANVKNSTGRIGLDHVDAFTSEEGLPLYKDHEYEVVSVYNNTSGEPVDAMAVMFLYMMNRDYRRPVL